MNRMFSPNACSLELAQTNGNAVHHIIWIDCERGRNYEKNCVWIRKRSEGYNND